MVTLRVQTPSFFLITIGFNVSTSTERSLMHVLFSTTTPRRTNPNMVQFTARFATPMDRYKYIKSQSNKSPGVSLKVQPNEQGKNGYVYCEIARGMYGLPQAGKLANVLLKKSLLETD